MDNYFCKRFAIYQAIAKYDAMVLHFTQLSNMTPQEYADDLVAKPYMVADLYDEGT